jgi:hypothetical protein
MTGFDSPSVLWLLVAIQVLGVFTAALARFSGGCAHQVVCHRLFFVVLSLVGAAAMVASAVGPGCLVTCSATLAFMVLTTTCDFRAGREAATW